MGMKTKWALPEPSTALLRGVEFEVLPRRRYKLRMAYEGDSGDDKIELIFSGVEVYKCTYFSSCSAEIVRSAYDHLVEIENSDSIRAIGTLWAPKGKDPSILHHYAILFDDGPFYEFICEGYSVVE